MCSVVHCVQVKQARRGLVNLIFIRAFLSCQPLKPLPSPPNDGQWSSSRFARFDQGRCVVDRTRADLDPDCANVTSVEEVDCWCHAIVCSTSPHHPTSLTMSTSRSTSLSGSISRLLFSTVTNRSWREELGSLTKLNSLQPEPAGPTIRFLTSLVSPHDR
jgi:hypothetical protein